MKGGPLETCSKADKVKKSKAHKGAVSKMLESTQRRRRGVSKMLESTQAVSKMLESTQTSCLEDKKTPLARSSKARKVKRGELFARCSKAHKVKIGSR